MSTILILLVALADAKKPKTPAGPSPEVQAAMADFSAAGTEYMAAYGKADVFEIQQTVWGIGDDGAAFQPRVDALKAKVQAAEDRMMAANTAVGPAMQANDPAGLKAAADGLRAEIAGLAALVAEADALRAEVTSAATVPTSLAVADLRATSMGKLQRIFAAAGWTKEGAAIGSMASAGYKTENFDVAKDGKVLNVSVIRPDATATGTGGMAPKAVAAKAAKGTAMRYHEPTDTYVEIRPGEGATPADAQALLAQMITP